MQNDDRIDREEVYYMQLCLGLFPEEQKGCHRKTREAGDLLYIDQNILKQSKVRGENVVMASIDYKKSMIWSHELR